MKMRLLKTFGVSTAGAAFYFIQAGHRADAVEQAILVVRLASNEGNKTWRDDPLMAPLLAGEWIIETLIQGAWIREYHEWEKATKAFFDEQCRLNNTPIPDWNKKLSLPRQVSHVDRVREQLLSFSVVAVDAAIDEIDRQRKLINKAKHGEDYFVTEENYKSLVKAVEAFWNEAASQSEISPLPMVSRR